MYFSAPFWFAKLLSVNAEILDEEKSNFFCVDQFVANIYLFLDRPYRGALTPVLGLFLTITLQDPRAVCVYRASRSM